MITPNSRNRCTRVFVLLTFLTLCQQTLAQQPSRVSGPATPLSAGKTTIPADSVPAPVVTAEASSASSSSVITASATEPVARSMQSILLKAKSELDPSKLPDPESSKSELEAALQELENFVVIGSENGKAWSKFLRLDELRAQLESDFPQAALLAELEMNMRQNYRGLEYPQFVRLREKLNQYVRAVRYGASPDNTIRLLGKKIDDLVVELNEPIEDTGLLRSTQVGVVANYLHESRQVPWAVSQLRSQFSSPNVQVYARESFINRLLMRSVAEPSPVDECILGTRILGRACLAGSVSADVVPMLDGLSMRLNLSATMTSQNRGYNRGVVLNTTGTSPVFASKQIFISQNGVSSTPAFASTNLHSQINSIEHKLRIVRKIAKKKAAQQKPQADAIAQGRLQAKVQSQYDQQVNEQLAQASGQLSALRQNRAEVKRIDFPQPSLAIYSTDSTVHGNVVQAAAYQLSASGTCMLPKPVSSEVLVEAHQSALINAVDVLLGSRTVHSENLDEYAQQITGSVSEEIRAEANGEPWSITFAPFRPVEFEFDDNRATITLRISKMTRGDQELQDSAIISATYVPSFADGVLTLHREGEVVINFARSSRGVRAVTLRSFLKNKFETTFKQEIVTKRIDLRQRFPNAPDLVVDVLSLEDGWLQLGLR